jgi:hypothetical protein
MAPFWFSNSPSLPGEAERLLSTARRIHCLKSMKSHVLGAVLVALLAAGCATQDNILPAEQRTTYNKPLTSPGAKFGALPPVVQLTVLAEAGTAEVVDVFRDTSSGNVVYKIYFRDHDIYPRLLVAPDGSVLNEDLTVAVAAFHGLRVKPNEVPVNVMKVIPERAPAGQIAYVTLETWGGRAIYVVTFKDEAHNPKLLIASDGTVVQESP